MRSLYHNQNEVTVTSSKRTVTANVAGASGHVIPVLQSSCWDRTIHKPKEAGPAFC